MEFKLIYQGSLHAASTSNTRVQNKQLIRKELHKQLKNLWQVQYPLSKWMTQIVDARNSITGQDITVVEAIAEQYPCCGYRFVPIVTQMHSLACHLDILFLRRDSPGNIIKSGGDIDNRLKVLFDALRLPSNCAELGGVPAGADENPFFVLLEDDSLITKVSVSTDRLLTPMKDGEHINDVHLIIGVRVNVMNVRTASSSIEFLSS